MSSVEHPGIEDNFIEQVEPFHPNQIQKPTRGQSEKEKVEIEEARSIVKLREDWSNSVKFWITLLIYSQIFTVLCVGIGALDYRDHPWLVPSLLVENFLQIIALGLFVVKYLYPNLKEYQPKEDNPS